MKALISFEQALHADDLSQKKYAVPAAVLMERAGIGCADVLFEDMRVHGRSVSATTVVAVCGASNNGGDAQVVLREAHARGAKVRALFVKEAKSDLARMQCTILQSLAISYSVVTAVELKAELSVLSHCDYIIDGITGVGLRGAYRERAIIQAVNEGRTASDAQVIAIDVPSGMEADEPLYGGEETSIVYADITASIGLRKMPLYFPSYRKYCGTIVDVENIFPISVVDTQLQRLCAELGSPVAYLLERSDRRVLHTPLERDVYKHKRGSVAVAAGSQKSPGAAFLALESATRGSAGLVYAGLDTDIAPHASLACPSAVVSLEGLSSFVQRISSGSTAIDAWVVGCGWGKRNIQVLADICNTKHPVICDADALTMLGLCQSKNSEWDAIHRCLKVLTPHVGELYSLLRGMSRNNGEEKDSDKQGIRCFETAQAVAQYYNAVVVAKNSISYITHPHKNIPYVVDGRIPILATGGSGDVLAGFLGSVLAHEYSQFVEISDTHEGTQYEREVWNILQQSAAYASLVHMEAGRYLEHTQGSGNASDIVTALSAVHALV